jgi:hypothetical protein
MSECASRAEREVRRSRRGFVRSAWRRETCVRASTEGGLNIFWHSKGPPRGRRPMRVTATAPDALALKFFDGL